jgi:hypothetical protein
MSTVTPAQSSPPSIPLASPAVYRMTVDEFERVADLLRSDQVELIERALKDVHRVARRISRTARSR